MSQRSPHRTGSGSHRTGKQPSLAVRDLPRVGAPTSNTCFRVPFTSTWPLDREAPSFSIACEGPSVNTVRPQRRQGAPAPAGGRGGRTLSPEMVNELWQFGGRKPYTRPRLCFSSRARDWGARLERSTPGRGGELATYSGPSKDELPCPCPAPALWSSGPPRWLSGIPVQRPPREARRPESGHREPRGHALGPVFARAHVLGPNPTPQNARIWRAGFQEAVVTLGSLGVGS